MDTGRHVGGWHGEHLPLLEESFALLSSRPGRHGAGDRRRRAGTARLETALPDAHFTGFWFPARRCHAITPAPTCSCFLHLGDLGQRGPEAMASGLAVIAYRHATMAELITPEYQGLLVTPGDATAFREEQP
ncbi:hypothetical protein DSL92_03165 [Billgrantia gudaonensis]|uniref:Uncharacterized protein n=1 Tax=Billgrantia gudaonensis TaxID=376427 RepID=A0A432JL42_9GAMM|nr:hypothetical protein DSL92_03165 [Halomonas gudaonensis]